MKREVYIAVPNYKYFNRIGQPEMDFRLTCITFCQWFLPTPIWEGEWTLYRCDKRIDRKRIREHFEYYGFETRTIVRK